MLQPLRLPRAPLSTLVPTGLHSPQQHPLLSERVATQALASWWPARVLQLTCFPNSCFSGHSQRESRPDRLVHS